MKKSKKGFELQNLKKGGMYNVPEDYFNTLPDRVTDSIKVNEITNKRQKSRSQKFWPALLIAASILGFLMIGYYSYNYILNTRNESLISSNNAMEYIDFYAHDFDESIILENIVEINENEQGINDQSETLIYYLLDEGIDELALYNEL